MVDPAQDSPPPDAPDGLAPGPAPPVEKPLPPMRLDWMRTRTQWGTRARPGAAGLRLDDLDIGADGQERLRHTLQAQPQRRPEFHGYLRRAEVSLTQDLADPIGNGALVVLLGEDVEATALGLERLRALRRAQARAYLARLAAAGLDRRDQQWPHFAFSTGQISRDELDERLVQRRAGEDRSPARG